MLKLRLKHVVAMQLYTNLYYYKITWTRASTKAHQMLERIHSSASSKHALGFVASHWHILGRILSNSQYSYHNRYNIHIRSKHVTPY